MQKHSKKIYSQQRFFFVFMCLFSLLIICTGFLPDVTFFNGVSSLIIILSLLLCGYGIASFFDFVNSNMFYAMCLGFGYCIFVICAIISSILHISNLNYIIIFAFVIFGFFRLRSQTSKGLSIPFIPHPIILTCILFTIIASFVGVTLYSLLPECNGQLNIYQDVTWNIGNANNLKLSFPPNTDFHILGVEFNYHYLSFVFKGFLSRLGNYPTSLAFLVYSQFISIPFIFFSCSALAELYVKKERIACFVPLLFLFVTCASSFWQIVTNTFDTKLNFFLNNIVAHVLYVPNGLDYAIPILMFMFCLYFNLMQKKKITLLHCATIVVLSLVLTGTKSPAGMLFVGISIGMMVIVALKEKKYLRNSVFLCFCILIGYYIAFVWFLGMGSPGEGSVKASMFTTIERLNFYHYVISPLLLFLNGRFPQILPLMKLFIYLMSVFLILCSYKVFSFIPFCLQLIDDIIYFKKARLEHFAMYGLVVAGFLCYFLLAIDGSSQIYFSMICTIGIDIIAVVWIKNNLKKLKYWSKLFLLCALIIGFISAINSHIYFWKQGVQSVALQETGERVVPNDTNITSLEYTALKWLRDNTPKDSLIATDRHFLYPIEATDKEYEPVPNDPSRFFYYSAISERQMFIEGWAYMPRTEESRLIAAEKLKINNSFYLENQPNRQALLLENEIDYVIVSRFIHPSLVLDGIELVYQNADIDIYKVQP